MNTFGWERKKADYYLGKEIIEELRSIKTRKMERIKKFIIIVMKSSIELTEGVIFFKLEKKVFSFMKTVSPNTVILL